MKKWMYGGFIAPEFFKRFGTEGMKIIHDGEWDIAYAVDEESAAVIVKALNHYSEIVIALGKLVDHDLAQDKREGIPPCVELQDAADLLKKLASEATA